MNSTSYDDHFNDIDAKLPKLKSNELHFKTLKIPVKKRHFDCELEDGLFEQLFIKIKTETTRNSLDILDYYTQAFVFNNLKRVLYSDSDFTFGLVFIKKTLSAKNEDLAKLVLNLLNVLFLWLDLGILDLHPIFMLFHHHILIYLYLHLPVYLFNKITQFLLFANKRLKKVKPLLYERLKARKKKLPEPRRF